MAKRFVSLIGIALGAALLPLGPAAPQPDVPTVQACGTGSWIGGTVDICNGTLMYRDYVYDDYGADRTDPTAPTTGSLSRPAGDERYPEGQEATADLIDLSLSASGDTLPTTGSPWGPESQHGGPPAALLAWAIERLADGVVSRFTMELLGPVPLGALTVSARVERPGRSVQLVAAELYDEQRDRTVATARA